MKEIHLKIGDDAFRTIKDSCYAAGLAQSDGVVHAAWVKVIDAILDGKTRYELKTKAERELESREEKDYHPGHEPQPTREH